ncbi:hypothetical protein KQI36_11025 [Clostridium senegalense]|uniref:S41 family peptidase n=1 Tax=Clostridium senegalense TaxID=1465809 RepID=UPI001C112266|nr:S41 family peptidase [Clostridium senegalense]MBU5227173.1 hypothetical protein [Clostridium senegalense]
MYKRLIALVLSFLCLFSMGCIKTTEAITNENKKFTNEQWNEDIDYLVKELSEKHPNPFYKINEKEWIREVKRLKKDVPKLTDEDIYMRLYQLTALLKDAHTHVYWDQLESKIDDMKIYPISLYWFGDELRVFSTFKGNEDILGKKLIAVNGIPLNKVLEKVNTLVSYENNQWAKATNFFVITYYPVLKFLNITDEEKCDFTFEDNNGKNVTKNLNVVLYKDLYDKNSRIKLLSEEVRQKLIKNQKPEGQDDAYWFKFVEKDKIFYFQYNQCLDSNFDTFLESLIKEINSNEENMDKFVVDLRKNTGGDSRFMSRIITALNRDTKIKDKKVFALIGKETFSSGCMAATDLKFQLNAKLVGEETGGNAKCYGNLGWFNLPNTDIEVDYSTEYYDLGVESDGGVLPDIEVIDSFRNYLKGIDECYETVKDK